MLNRVVVFVVSVLLISCGGGKDEKTSDAPETKEEKAPVENLFEITEGQEVFFVNLKDGDQVTSPVKVEMGVKGMEIEPAGEINKNKGHHHILIGEPFYEAEKAVPADSTHIHYGKGQTETELALPVGKHRISLQFANGAHQSYGEKMSASIEIEVVEAQ